jgi:hypothetical protein
MGAWQTALSSINAGCVQRLYRTASSLIAKLIFDCLPYFVKGWSFFGSPQRAPATGFRAFLREYCTKGQ